MVANKPGNLDGETAGSTVWTPPNELVVAAARARDAVAPSAERSALLKEKERQRSKRRRENATAEQRAKERARSARRRNALTPDEKQAQALKRAERRKERKANGTLPAPKRAHRPLALAGASPERPLALRAAGEVDPATPGELGTFVEAVTAAAGAKATGAHIGKGLTADDDAGDLRAVVPQIASATERRTPKKASTEEQRAAERNRSKMRRAAMTDEQRKKESQARAERRRRSKALAAGGGGDGATAE